MTLFLPVGIPGSGKSYLGREWFKPSEIICPDDYREIITGDMSDQTANTEVFSIVRKLTEERLKRDLDVFLDATNLNPRLWPEAERRVVILMETPHEESYERNRMRERRVPDHVMDKMAQSWESLTTGPYWNPFRFRFHIVPSNDFNRRHWRDPDGV